MNGDDRAGYRVLLACIRRALRLTGDPLSISSGLAWPRLIALAERHDIIPLLNAALHGCTAVPLHVRRLLETRCRTMLAHNLALASELAEILELFERSAIHAIPFKGPAWTKALYGGMAYRQIRDLDILVDRSEVTRAGEALAERGYAPGEQSKAKPLDQSLAQCKDIEWIHHETGLHLELHWSASEPWFDRRLHTLKLWEPASAIMLMNRMMPLPTPENMFSLLAIHGARHRWESLKWLCDVAALLGTFPQLDLAGVISRAGEISRRRIVLLPLALVNRLFAVELPSPVLRTIEQDAGVAALASKIERRHYCIHEFDAGSRPEAVARLFDHEGIRIQMRDGRFERIRLRAAFFIRLMKPSANDRAAFWLLRPYRLMRAYGPVTFLKLTRQFIRSA